MGQAEILDLLDKQVKILKKEVKKIDEEDLLIKELWDNAFSRDDFIEVLGLSLKSVSTSLKKLGLQDKIIKLKSDEDRRCTKYVKKDDRIIDLVNKRND